jgi:hypothetical protein
LFPIDIDLLHFTDLEFAAVERAYAGLVHRLASNRMLAAGRESRVEVGPTGTAKVLFALRPNALIPWDDPMRAHFRLDGSAHSYANFLRGVKLQLEALGSECAEHGFESQELPRILGRTDSSLPKLIDEFHWVTISRRCPTPQQNVLRRWISWLG